ncbi:MAG: ATP-binding protein [Cyclobacteriaceae bacterium]|nr:ATP-binding protein [Cyclobacteriaceae bacterium]
MRQVLKDILADFHTSPLQVVTPRELELPLNSGKAISLIGPRRSGKSFYFFHLMHQLVSSGVPKTNILYLNFEDERLNLKAEDLDNVLKAYHELYPDTNWKECYFFFDEIQNISHWEKFARRCYDSYTRNLFLTGSNAKLLSMEIATAMRGRTLTFEILPLSFREYLSFKKVNYSKQDSATKAKIGRLFHAYLEEGGYPEVVLLPDSLKTQALQEYFDVMTYRDLVERYAFTNLPVVKYFLKRLANTTGSYLSLNKLYNELRSQGYKLDKNFLYEANEAAKAVYLSIPVSKFDFSELKRANSDKKNYFIDNGLLNAITFKFSKDYGKLLENLCYLELRRQKREIYYYKDTKECDFVLFEKDRPTPLQVSYSITDPDTYERELKGLLHTCKKLKSKKGVIISTTPRPDEKIEGVQVSHVAALDFVFRQEREF